jgi:hypothetical protein
MQARTLIGEILYPLTDTAVVLALIVFLFLQALATAAGFLGVYLAIVIVPAYFRYLLRLLEARANGRNPPPPGIELFNWVENYWSLFPLVLLCLLGWGTYFLATLVSPVAALLFGVCILLVYPASLAILAVTRSPLESLNPAALVVLIKMCGRDYLLIPLVTILLSVLTGYLAFLQTSALLTKAVGMYASFLLFTLTGAVMRENAANIDVEIPLPLEPNAERLNADLTRQRTKVLDHAYGFVSRDNRRGGLQHIYDWIEKEDDADAAYRWFFEQTLKWESKDAALFFAQTYLSRLLSQGRDVQVLKLIARCRLVDSRFRPNAADMDAALATAERQGNDELYDYLRR